MAHCPRCAKELAAREDSLARGLRCGSCRGWWLRLDSLSCWADEGFLARLKAGASRVAPQPAMRCPQCRVAMVRVAVPARSRSVVVDRCGKCAGVWLGR